MTLFIYTPRAYKPLPQDREDMLPKLLLRLTEITRELNATERDWAKATDGNHEVHRMIALAAVQLAHATYAIKLHQKGTRDGMKEGDRFKTGLSPRTHAHHHEQLPNSIQAVVYNRHAGRGICLNGGYLEDLFPKEGAYYRISLDIHEEVPPNEGDWEVFGKGLE